jgi:hypothetical protein
MFNSPLKAETGVRFPLGAPANEINGLHGGLAVLAAVVSGSRTLAPA